SEKEREFPPMVILDVCNVCNLECIHCPHVTLKKEKSYQPTFLKWEWFEKIANEVGRHPGTLLRYASDGESLLHPRFVDMVAYAHQNGVNLQNLTTNGYALGAETSKKLLKAGMDVIDVSLDAFRKETYERIRVKSNYHRIMSNVHKLIELRDKISPDTKIMVSIVDQPEAKGEVDDFVDYWTPLVDRVLVRNLCNVLGLVKTPGEEAQSRYPCPQFWKRITITCSGNFRFCVEDWRNQTVVGHIEKNSIEEIWKGEEYEVLRKLHLEGRYDEIPVCKNCTDWQASPWDYGYEYAIAQIQED
ncbi:MAG: SPASM domain-containing protein, partial [Proteobacteria bacterium]|nr:SPASM domain-containing protein [Pseudomonadota bacterium]